MTPEAQPEIQFGCICHYNTRGGYGYIKPSRARPDGRNIFFRKEWATVPTEFLEQPGKLVLSGSPCSDAPQKGKMVVYYEEQLDLGPAATRWSPRKLWQYANHQIASRSSPTDCLIRAVTMDPLTSKYEILWEGYRGMLYRILKTGKPEWITKNKCVFETKISVGFKWNACLIDLSDMAIAEFQVSDEELDRLERVYLAALIERAFFDMRLLAGDYAGDYRYRKTFEVPMKYLGHNGFVVDESGLALIGRFHVANAAYIRLKQEGSLEGICQTSSVWGQMVGRVLGINPQIVNDLRYTMGNSRVFLDVDRVNAAVNMLRTNTLTPWEDEGLW